MTHVTRRVLGFAIVALASGVITLFVTRQRLPELDQEQLQDATARWRAAAIQSYDLSLTSEGSGLTRGEFRVIARAGSPLRVFRDGISVTGAAEAWAVDGLLASLRTELELARDASRNYGAPPGYHAYLYARFDELGVPSRFRRVVGGSNSWVEWTVTAFSTPPPAGR